MSGARKLSDHDVHKTEFNRIYPSLSVITTMKNLEMFEESEGSKEIQKRYKMALKEQRNKLTALLISLDLSNIDKD